MDGFRLPPEKMREVATKFTTCAEDMVSTAEMIIKSAAELDGSWEGAGSAEFQNDITKYKDACDKMVTLLQERSQALNSSAQAAEELSDALSKQWQ